MSRRLSADGAAVAVVDLRLADAQDVADEISADGRDALAISADVGQESEVAQAVEEACARFGHLEIVVPNAGVELIGNAPDSRDAAVHELSLTAWQQTITTNLTGVFLTSKYGVQALLRGRGGAIVITGSPTGIYGMELGAHAYTASKGGVHALARVMATEYAARGIRVNVILPGFTETGINRPSFADKSKLESIVQRIPMMRAAAPEEIAGVVSFLASEDASYITGALLAIDGGLTAI